VNSTVGGSNYTAANGQLLSPLGTVVPATLGPANDLFFLSFDQIGTHVHAYVDPTVTPSPPVPNSTPQPDFGVATFERVNHSLSRITGVPITDSVVNTLYQQSQQSMPAAPLISAFVSSQQAAISQLANAYCGEMLNSAQLTHSFFSGALDNQLGGSGAAFFGASGSPQRQAVINALVSNTVGSANPQTASAIQTEVDALITRILISDSLAPAPHAAIEPNATVLQTVTSACTAVLGSAAVTLQ
jgi:hypothetical protein